MPSNDSRSSKADRREQAREQARQLREQQKKKERRNRTLAISGLVAAVVVLAIVAVTIVRQGSEPGLAYSGDDADTITLADATAPSTAGSDGGIPVGADGVAGEAAADGDVVVTVYMDYMCPYCGQFEAANDSELAALREEGGVTVEYHVISFLDSQSSGGQYSTRAGNASAVVADQAPEQFAAFNSALFANQPEEGTTGLDDDEIAQIALDAGVPQDVVDSFTDTVSETDGRLFAKWLVANTNAASEALGGISTPTVLIDGEQFTGDLYNAGPLTEAVEAAKG